MLAMKLAAVVVAAIGVLGAIAHDPAPSSAFLAAAGAVPRAVQVVNHLKEQGSGYVEGTAMHAVQQRSHTEPGDAATTTTATTTADPAHAHVDAARLEFFILSVVLTFVPFVVAVVLGTRAKSCLSTSPTKTAYERMFLGHWNAKFAIDFELAVRGGVFAIIAGIPFICPQLDFLVKSGRYHASAVVMFLFTLYKTVGDTVNFAFVGMVGTFIAVFNIWVLFGIFPAGVSETSPDHVWYAGVTNAFLFGFFILWLNFDNSLRMFALSWHCYFIMTFLNPANNTFNGGFALSMRGPAISALLMSGIGAGMAIVAVLVPYPIYALDKARKCAIDLTNDLAVVWTDALVCYAGDARSRPLESKLSRLLGNLKSSSDELGGHVATAWWECLGRGRGQKVRVFLSELEPCLKESYNRLCTLNYVCSQEGYDVKHRTLMKTLKKPMEDCSNSAGELMKLVVKAAADGELDAEEVDEVKVLRQQAERNIEDLTRTFNAHVGTLDETLLGEAAFAMSYCTYARIAIEYADTLEKKNTASTDAPSPSIMTMFDKNVLLDKDHLNFVLRNGLSLALSFIIGYNGYSQIIQNYNSGPAGTVSLLLSSFVGAAIVKNLGRLQGAVLGTVVGQIAYAYLAWCTLGGYLSVAMFTFAWSVLTLFVYYNSEAHGYIGCLLAAFGVQGALGGCSNEVFLPHGTYHMIINTIIGIAMMTFCDLALSPDRSSDLTNKRLRDAWDTYKKAFEKFFDSKDPNVMFHNGELNAKLISAASISVQANMEPRWWRTPFKERLMFDTVSCGLRLREHLCNMENSGATRAQDGETAIKKSSFLCEIMAYDSFKKVREDINSRWATVSGLLEIFSHEVAATFDKDSKVNEKVNKAQSLESIELFVKEVKGKGNFASATAHRRSLESLGRLGRSSVSDEMRSLEMSRICQVGLFVVSLQGQIHVLADLKQMILSTE